MTYSRCWPCICFFFSSSIYPCMCVCVYKTQCQLLLLLLPPTSSGIFSFFLFQFLIWFFFFFFFFLFKWRIRRRRKKRDGSFGPFICKRDPAEQRVNIFYSINVAFSSGTLRRRHNHHHTHITCIRIKEKEWRRRREGVHISNDFTKGFPRETGASQGDRRYNPSGQTVDGVTFVTGSYI